MKKHPWYRHVTRCIALTVLAGASAFAWSATHEAPAHDHARAAQGPSVTSLDVYARGDTVDLLTGETNGADSATTLWHRQSRDGGKSWSNPTRVDTGLPSARRPHRGNDAQIASDGRHVIAAWTTAGRGWLGSGALITAYSADAGKTWRRGGTPAGDEREDGQSYADLSARGGRFHLAWLDSRGGSQGVRYAMSADGGASWRSNASIKAGSCECCWNTLLPAADDSVYLLFRNKAPRDMGLAVSRDDGASWKPAGPVGAFNWQIDACPHTGGALAMTGHGASERLHAVVWTGKPDVRGLHVLSARDAGSGWTPVARLGGEYAQRADLASAGGELIAVWDESVGRQAAVFLARSQSGGQTWSQPVRLSSEGVNAIYPRVVAARANLLVLWTEAAAGGESRLRMVLMK
ncbi:MAG TPA: sialidase family protein [Burkholderiales bacterium]|nr:sialidase family protein [Burkholderiales bacterium]